MAFEGFELRSPLGVGGEIVEVDRGVDVLELDQEAVAGEGGDEELRG